MTRIIYKKRLKFTFQAFAYTICLIMKSQGIIFFILSKHKPQGIFYGSISLKNYNEHYIYTRIYITWYLIRSQYVWLYPNVP